MARGRSGRNGAGGGGCAGCFLGFLLKFLAFLQAFAAVSAVLYGAWIVSRWARHHELHLDHLLPDLWFACAVMAAGLLYCAILLAGYIAAEISSGCCLCFYTVLAMAMLLLEASVAGHLLLNEHWMQDLPYDRTGELNNLVSFVQNNLDLCKWTALATLATQALSLLLAMVLRAMVSTSRDDYDSDEDFVVIRRPLLVAQGAPSYLPTTADPRGVHPQLWSSSMRQKDTENNFTLVHCSCYLCSLCSPSTVQPGLICTKVNVKSSENIIRGSYMDERGVDYARKKLDGRKQTKERYQEGEIRGPTWPSVRCMVRPPPLFLPWPSPTPGLLRRVAACASPKRIGHDGARDGDGYARDGGGCTRNGGGGARDGDGWDGRRGWP